MHIQTDFHIMQLLEITNTTKAISLVEAQKLIQLKCSHAYKHDIKIYRGIHLNGEAFVATPPKFRKSAHTLNYSTLLVDNDPAWKVYPKRSESFICTTDKKQASSYGTVYRVYPYDNANIGICPAEDFWLSFKQVYRYGNPIIYDIDDLNYKIFQLLKDGLNYNQYHDTDFIDFKRCCDIIDNKINMGEELFLTDYNLDIFYTKVTLNGTRSLIAGLQHILNPDANNFDHVNINEIISAPPFKEVWTNSPCIFIAN